MKLEALELFRFRMPLVTPFRTSYGTDTDREVLIVRALTSAGEGWGECVAESSPSYSSEFLDAADMVIRRFMAPVLFSQAELSAPRVGPALSQIRDYRMAKAALEAAVLDAELCSVGMSLADYLGGVRSHVPVGVSVGIQESPAALIDLVESYVGSGYQRIKLKIEPGWDLVPVQAVRERFGPDLLLQVDANTSYRRQDISHLVRLDPSELLLIEQPFPPEDLGAHAELARRSSTPVCLDESIESAADAFTAISMGACSVINIKAGRVGGYLEARRIHDVCAAAGVPVWCGGMLETGIGRAANVALAALPNFMLPGDISATDRYFERDITEAFHLVGSTLAVPTGPGIGVEVNMDAFRDLKATRSTLRPDGS
jgi:O-succinylbenzoate synthase